LPDLLIFLKNIHYKNKLYTLTCQGQMAGSKTVAGFSQTKDTPGITVCKIGKCHFSLMETISFPEYADCYHTKYKGKPSAGVEEMCSLWNKLYPVLFCAQSKEQRGHISCKQLSKKS